jgi:probable addiction module antidote protein
MALKTIPFDGSEFFNTPESQMELLTEAFETGHPEHIAYVLGVVARARGMTSIAKEAGVTREALYKALSQDGDPKLSTLMGVARALGLKITAEPLSPSDRQTPRTAAE